MTIQRIADLPKPGFLKKFQTVEDVQEYLEHLVETLQRHQSDRVQDFDILQISNVGWADARGYGTPANAKQDGFAKAIAHIGSTATTLLIANQQDISADITVPANVTLDFTHSGSLAISTGVTVTINGHINAGPHQIFSGAGVVSFGDGSVNTVRPEWWGAVVNSTSTDCVTPLNSMVTAMQTLSNGCTAEFQQGVYYVGSVWALTDRYNLRFVGKGNQFLFTDSGTIIQPNDSFSGTEIVKLDGCNCIEAFGINIYARDPAEENTFNGLVITGDNDPHSVMHIRWRGFAVKRADTSIYIGTATANEYQFQNCAIEDFEVVEGGDVGIHIRSQNVDHLTVCNGIIRTLNDNAVNIYIERSGLIKLDTISGSGNDATGSIFIKRGSSTASLVCINCHAEALDYHMLDQSGSAQPTTNLSCHIDKEYKVDTGGTASNTVFVGGYINNHLNMTGTSAIVTSYGMQHGGSYSLTETTNSRYYREPHRYFKGTFTLNPSEIANGDCGIFEVSVTGAELGRGVKVTPPYTLQGMLHSAHCKEAGVINVCIYNGTGEAIDLAEGTWKYSILDR